MKVVLGPESQWWGHVLEHRILLYLLSCAGNSGAKRGKVLVGRERFLREICWKGLVEQGDVERSLALLADAGEVEGDLWLEEDLLRFTLLRYDVYADPPSRPQPPCPEADDLMQVWGDTIGTPPRPQAQQKAFRLMLTRDSSQDPSITFENVKAVIEWLPSQRFKADKDVFPGWGKICKTPSKLREQWSAMVKANGAPGVWEMFVDQKHQKDQADAWLQDTAKQAKEAFGAD